MGKTKEFAYTTDVTNSIDFVMDVNGKKGPNSEATGQKTYDIRGFRAARFKGCPGVKIGEYCALNLGKSYDCIDTCSDTTWDTDGNSYQYCSNNCWAGAKKACDDLGMYVPSYRQHASFYNSKGLEGIPTDGEYFSSEPSTSTGENFVVHYRNISWSSYFSKSEKFSLFCID